MQGERCGELLWFVQLHIKPRGWQRKNKQLHHIKQRIVYCSSSVSAETHMTFSYFKGWAASTSSSLCYNKKQKVAAPEWETLPPKTGCKHFRNLIFKDIKLVMGFLSSMRGIRCQRQSSPRISIIFCLRTKFHLVVSSWWQSNMQGTI